MAKAKHDLGVLNSWSKELAYLLGWTLTDASVENKDNKRHTVAWQLKDLEPLLIFKKLFKIEREIEYCKRKQGNYHRLRIHGREAVDKFIGYGIGPNKSLTVQMPYIPEKLKSHFFRGVFEGDGSVYWRFPDATYKTRMLICNIVSGSLDFINSCKSELPYGRFSGKKQGSVYRIAFYSANADKFLNWIYQDSEGLRLTRKYNRFLYGKYNNFPEGQEEVENKSKDRYKDFHSVSIDEALPLEDNI